MRRRHIVQGSAVLPLVSLLGRAFGGTAEAAAPAAPTSMPFDASTVRNLARDAATKPFQPPDTALPPAFANLNYDHYRMIRFDPHHALWRDSGRYFTVEFFHRGFLYKNRVTIYEVADGKAQEIRYSPDMFSFGALTPPTGDLGFAGLRIHAPINRADYYDEVCAFLGASYFRAVAKGQGYGLSARGLALKTADPKGEEFPYFKTFWLERPAPGTRSIVVHALLDSQSTTGAFRFTIRPGEQTVFDTEATLYPRVDITESGIAPLTSMFSFDANDRTGVDDYRPAVHDSGGLLMWTGRGEQLWRALANPTNLQYSAFSDVNPRGFGLMQRKRAFHDYQDLEAHYEKRPSCWVEPIGDWGQGGVDLIEIPTKVEIHDNMVSFWRPKDTLHAKGEYSFTYRLHWCRDVPQQTKLAKIVATRAGLGWDKKSRLFVLDVLGDNLKALPQDAAPRADISADHGKIEHAVAQPNPETGGWRMSFDMAPAAKLVELRARLVGKAGPLSETWLYRWTS